MTHITNNTRKAVVDALIELAEKDKSIAFVCADSLKSMKAEEFKSKYPERYFDVGIAEQNAVGFAAGLASCGLKPYVATYSGFLTMRACEQIRTFVAYPELNVKFIGANGGLHGGEREGVTHQFFEDIGIMRSMPGVKVVSPADGPEVFKATKQLTKYDGPAFLRVGNGREPKIFNDEHEFNLDKAKIVKKSGTDVAIFVTGPIIKRVLKAYKELEREGFKTTVVEVHTLKPLDRETILQVIKETKAAITVEDHNIIGGLGSAIAELSCEEIPAIVSRVGLKDIYPESGEAEDLLDKYQMGIKDIIKATKNVFKKKKETFK